MRNLQRRANGSKKTFDFGIQYFSVWVFDGSRNPEPKKTALVLEFNICRFGFSLAPEIQSQKKTFDFGIQYFFRYGFLVVPESRA